MFPEVQRGLFGFLTEELVVCMYLVSNPSILQEKLTFSRSWGNAPSRSLSANVAASRGKFALSHQQTQDGYKLRQGLHRDRQAA